MLQHKFTLREAASFAGFSITDIRNAETRFFKIGRKNKNRRLYTSKEVLLLRIFNEFKKDAKPQIAAFCANRIVDALENPSRKIESLDDFKTVKDFAEDFLQKLDDYYIVIEAASKALKADLNNAGFLSMRDLRLENNDFIRDSFPAFPKPFSDKLFLK